VFKVGTPVVVDGDIVEVAHGTKSVVLTTTAPDATSVVTVRGNANFVTGDNDVIVKVTATDGSFAEYTVTITVADPSDDNSLDVLTLDGADVVDGDEITLPKGVTSVTIVATPAVSSARAVISGNTGLKTGANNVVIRVTAENGDVAVNTIVVTIAATNDEWLKVVSNPAKPFGTVAATLDGATTAVTLASTTSQLVVNGTGWNVKLSPYWLNKKATTLDSSKRLILAQGANALLSAGGFAPNSEARVYLGTTLLGTFTASATGTIAGTVTISATQKAGSYTLTITGFDAKFLARWVSVGMSVKTGYLTKVYTVIFKTTGKTVDSTAAKVLAAVPKLIKGYTSVLVDIKGWAAGSKISSTLTKLGVSRATAIKTSLTKLKVVATYTTAFGALEKSTSKTSKGVITVKYAKP
jgi:outer membrane protein OmpA-like peptidoglycan-associated protein